MPVPLFAFTTRPLICVSIAEEEASQYSDACHFYSLPYAVSVSHKKTGLEPVVCDRGLLCPTQRPDVFCVTWAPTKKKIANEKSLLFCYLKAFTACDALCTRRRCA